MARKLTGLQKSMLFDFYTSGDRNELARDLKVSPDELDELAMSLETITETLGSSGLKLVPHYMSFTELKKKLIH